MGPSLRQRLSKRASETTEVKSTSTADTAPPLLAALTHLQPPSTSKEDLNVTPPPPPDNLMLPRTPEKALESPASLLERYKERIPIAKAPAMPSPSEVLSVARSRIPNFPDNFDTSKELPLTPTPTYPPSGIPVATGPVKSTIRTVGGVDFQMVNSTQIATDVLQPRGSSAEPARAGVDDSEDIGFLLGQRRRLTRSQSRKEERSDSTVDDVSAETLQANIEASLILDDNGDGNDDEKDDKGTKTTESETPPARKVVKKKPGNPSTPTKVRPRASHFTRHLTADRKRKEEEALSLAPQTPTLPTTDNTNPTSNPNSDSESNSSSSSSADFALDSSTAAQIGPAAANPDFAGEPVPTIRILPPALAFHDQVLPGLLWASPLGSTSRPALPWTWCKRWTCCRCAGGTIVEQVVCSKLSCGHRRCGARCVVFEGRGGSVM